MLRNLLTWLVVTAVWLVIFYGLSRIEKVRAFREKQPYVVFFLLLILASSGGAAAEYLLNGNFESYGFFPMIILIASGLRSLQEEQK